MWVNLYYLFLYSLVESKIDNHSACVCVRLREREREREIERERERERTREQAIITQ